MSYGSMNASYYAIWEDFIKSWPDERYRFKSLFDREYANIELQIITIILSWIGFLIDKSMSQKGRKFLRFKNWTP